MAEIRLFIIEHYRQSTLKLLLLLFTLSFSSVTCGSLVILWHSIKTLLKLGVTHACMLLQVLVKFQSLSTALTACV